jgi:hypothetical protein
MHKKKKDICPEGSGKAALLPSCHLEEWFSSRFRITKRNSLLQGEEETAFSIPLALLIMASQCHNYPYRTDDKKPRAYAQSEYAPWVSFSSQPQTGSPSLLAGRVDTWWGHRDEGFMK